MFWGDGEVGQDQVDFVCCQQWDVVGWVGWQYLQLDVQFVGQGFGIVDVEVFDLFVFGVDEVEWWVVVEGCDV